MLNCLPLHRKIPTEKARIYVYSIGFLLLRSSGAFSYRSFRSWIHTINSVLTRKSAMYFDFQTSFPVPFWWIEACIIISPTTYLSHSIRWFKSSSLHTMSNRSSLACHTTWITWSPFFDSTGMMFGYLLEHFKLSHNDKLIANET